MSIINDLVGTSWPRTMQDGVQSLSRIGFKVGIATPFEGSDGWLGSVDLDDPKSHGSWTFSAHEGFGIHVFPTPSSRVAEGTRHFHIVAAELDAALGNSTSEPVTELTELNWTAGDVLVSWRMYGPPDCSFGMLSIEKRIAQ